MRAAIQARLDRETQKTLSEMRRRTGWSTSKLVREGLKLLSATQTRRNKKRIIGIGAFCSGVPDLASNKKHMKGFGE